MAKNRNNTREVQTRADAKRAGRTRNYATIVYPESAPSNWLEVLEEMHIQALVSPLHDRDILPTGEPKKAHYHVILLFESVKTMKQAREAIAKIAGVGCEPVNGLRGYARYLCHLDSPDKASYEVSEVLAFGGLDYLDMIGLPTDRYRVIGEMMDFCEGNGILEFCDLLDYARVRQQEWFRILCDSGTFVMREYLKSRRFKFMQGMK